MTNITKAWRQEQLKKQYNETEVPSILEIDTMLSNINYGKIDPVFYTKRARAMIALYYLTAGRLTEVTKRKYAYKIHSKKDENKRIIRKEVEKIEPEFKGIYKKDIVFDTIDDKPVMYVRLENRKNKRRTSKKQPIPLEMEFSIVKYIKEYLDIAKDNEPLFNITNKRATQIINDTIGFNAHFLRHIRATHLITLYDFNEQTLIEFMGWTDARPAVRYMELSKKDLFRAFYKNIK